MTEHLEAFREQWAARIETELLRWLPAADERPERLHEAMHYAVFPGGKRLRPVLVLLGAAATGGDLERALPAAAAVEFVHCYSLVHDDLPCMDDDALRRGRPTVHVAFDEATAVLAGDALLTLAFSAAAKGGAAAVSALARAAGSLGMVGGQAGDMEAQRQREADLRSQTDGRPGRGAVRGIDDVCWIHDRKTGALIAASLEIGALAGSGPGCPDALPDLIEYGRTLGRAFQIADDCLDVTAETATLGKQVRKDQTADKLTYPSVLGLRQSQAEAQRLAEQARQLAVAVCSWHLRPATLELPRSLLQDAASFTVARGS